jgi:uncharacterized protein (DUF1330 family)
MRQQVLLALACGVAIGATATGALHAQKRPDAAYYFAEIDVKDVEADKRILARYPAPAEAFGGRYLARGGKSVIFDGEPPRRVILVAFDSLDSVRAWRSAAPTREFEAARKSVGTSILRAFAIEGSAP